MMRSSSSMMRACVAICRSFDSGKVAPTTARSYTDTDDRSVRHGIHMM